MKKVLVLGVGQELRGDDGLGPRIVGEWVRAHPDSANQASVQVCAAPGLELLEHFANVDAVVLVDAVRSGARPGTVHVLNPGQLRAFDGTGRNSHGLGLAEILALGQELSGPLLPDPIIILGLEAGPMELGEPLSPDARAAIPAAVAKLEALVRAFIS